MSEEGGAVEEEARIRECVGVQGCPVFYVRALSGLFPIPQRYMLVTELGSELRSLTFTSDAMIAIGAREASAHAFMGYITMGLRRDFESGSSDEVKQSFVEMNGRCGVKAYRSQIGPQTLGKSASEAILLVKDDEYVVILDDNPRIADALLYGYCKINAGQIGR